MLKIPFPLDPFVPFLLHGGMVNILELTGIESFAAIGTRIKLLQLFHAVLMGQVADEPGTVQVGIHAHLKIDSGTFGLESDHIIKIATVADHGTKHHFIVSAHYAAYSTRHPGFHEHGDAFVVPARRVPARGGEVAVKQRQGIAVIGHHLAAEEPGYSAVGFRCHIAHHLVSQLMAHEPLHAFVRWDYGKRIIERRYADIQEVPWDDHGSAVAHIGKIVEKNIGGSGRRIFPELLVKGQCVLERTHGMGHEVGSVFIRENQFYV